MNMKPFCLFLGGFLMMLCSMLLSCQSNQRDANIFRYNESAGIATLDPAFAKNQAIMWPVHQLFNTLVEMDEHMNIVPSLAKSWSFSADALSICFLLRNDVYFHDDPVFQNGKGRRLTAKDVVYSLSRIIDPVTASPGAWIFNERVDSILPFEARNDSVFLLHLRRPYFPMMGILTMQYCSVVPKEVVEHYSTSFGRHPVGTGPFIFRAWHENQGLVLNRNEHYFEKDSIGNALPYLDGVYISFLENKSSEFIEFRQKHLDFINDIDPSFKDLILTHSGRLKERWKDDMMLDQSSYLNTEYLGILQEKSAENSLLQNKKIRQAIAHAISKKKLLYYLRNSIGAEAVNGFVPHGLSAYENNFVKGYNYDTAQARRLINESGLLERINNTVIKLQTVPSYTLIGNFIVSELKQVGLNVVLETVQKSVLLDLMSHSKTSFFRGSWIADYPDASNYLSVFYGKNPAPPNYTRYANPEYDRLFEQSLMESDTKKRSSLYFEMDSMLMEDAVVIPLWYDRVLHLIQPDVLNFHSNQMNMLELKRTRKR